MFFKLFIKIKINNYYFTIPFHSAVFIMLHTVTHKREQKAMKPLKQFDLSLQFFSTQKAFHFVPYVTKLHIISKSKSYYTVCV